MPDDDPKLETTEGSHEETHEETAAPEGPPASTLQEVRYLRQLVAGMVPVTIKVRNGEEFHGVVEYYDERFIRLTRKGAPNLFIFKKDIKYLHEDK